MYSAISFRDSELMSKCGGFIDVCSPAEILNLKGWLFCLPNVLLNIVWEKRLSFPGFLRKLKCFSLHLCLIFHSSNEIIENQALKL